MNFGGQVPFSIHQNSTSGGITLMKQKRTFPSLPNPDQGRVATHLAKLRSLPAEFYEPAKLRSLPEEYYEAGDEAFHPVESDGWFSGESQEPELPLPLLLTGPRVTMA